MKTLILITALLLSAPIVHAANVWKVATNIEGIQALPSGGVIIYLPLGADPICAENGRLFRAEPNFNFMTMDGVKNLTSLALVSFTTGKKVSILYDNSTANCDIQTLHLRND